MTTSHNDGKPRDKSSEDPGWLPAADGEFSRLVAAMCSGTAAHADRDRLEGLLRDPEVRRAYLAYMLVHGELQWRHARGASSDTPDPNLTEDRTRTGFRSRGPDTSRSLRAAFTGLGERIRGVANRLSANLSQPVPLSILLATALLGSGLLVAAFTTLSGDSEVSVTDVAGRVTGLHEAGWTGGAAPILWSPLASGAQLDLATGFVEVTLGGGGQIILQGPVVVVVRGAHQVAVEQGLVAARYDHSRARTAAGSEGGDMPVVPLTVETPFLTIDDLGTEFGVGVAADGTAEVHVFEGLVELKPAVATADSVPLRLGAGDAKQVSREGRFRPVTTGFASRIVRRFPGREPAELPPEWIPAEAVVICTDTFSGNGSLDSRPPSTRSGVGDDQWHVHGSCWTLADGLRHVPGPQDAGGSVSLPFVPEPGTVYRASVVMEVSAGGREWGAVGFLDGSNGHFFGSSAPAGYAWMGQRHRADPQLGGNFAAAGPGVVGKIERIDNHFGRHERMVQLDTRGRLWKVKFFVDGDLVAWHVFDRTPPIQFVGLGSAPLATATFTQFRLESWQPAASRRGD